MTRLPITVRLTLVFAAALAAVLMAFGLFIHLRLGTELDHALDEGLQSRADDVTTFVRRAGPSASGTGGRRFTDAGESAAQIVDAGGRVVGGTPRNRSLLTRPEAQRATQRTLRVGRRSVAGSNEGPLRLLATPVSAQGQRLSVVVGASVGDRDEALRDLDVQLLIGGPFALLLGSLIAFWVVHAALAPVESMRRQAAAISAAHPGRRLPLAPNDDELSRLGETLNAMLARLEAALAHERSFVSDASHELRTPLAILKTELELALRHGRTVEELREAVRSAGEETERLVAIAQDLLVTARSDQRVLPIRHEPNDVGVVFEAVRRRFAHQAQEAGCLLEADAPTGLVLLADRLRLEQAMGNMVDNALRHGGGCVRMEAREGDGVIELHVLDEGPGFAPGFVDRAFERFSRADEARGGPGTGLGLAVVQSIATAHGGSARADSRSSGGADVWLCLPVTASAALDTDAGASIGADDHERDLTRSGAQ